MTQWPHVPCPAFQTLCVGRFFVVFLFFVFFFGGGFLDVFATLSVQRLSCSCFCICLFYVWEQFSPWQTSIDKVFTPPHLYCIDVFIEVLISVTGPSEKTFEKKQFYHPYHQVSVSRFQALRWIDDFLVCPGFDSSLWKVWFVFFDPEYLYSIKCLFSKKKSFQQNLLHKNMPVSKRPFFQIVSLTTIVFQNSFPLEKTHSSL